MDGRRGEKIGPLSGSKSQSCSAVHKMPVFMEGGVVIQPAISPSCCLGLGTSNEIRGRGGLVESVEKELVAEVGQFNVVSVVRGCIVISRELWVRIERS